MEPYKGLIPAAPKGALVKTASRNYYRQPLEGALFPEGIHVLLGCHLIRGHVLVLLEFDVPLYSFLVCSYRTHVIPLHQKFLFPYLYFRLAYLSKIISVLLPFRYPIKLETEILGGIRTSIWM